MEENLIINGVYLGQITEVQTDSNHVRGTVTSSSCPQTRITFKYKDIRVQEYLTSLISQSKPVNLESSIRETRPVYISNIEQSVSYMGSSVFECTLHLYSVTGSVVDVNSYPTTNEFESIHNQHNEEGNTMNTSMKSANIASLMLEGLKTVSVRVSGISNAYTYKTLDDYEEGDMVVVKMSSSLKVGQVKEVHKVPRIDVDSNINYDWIFSKVDSDGYEAMVEKEEVFAETLLELQQKSVRENATRLVSEKLGISEHDLIQASAVLKISKDTSKDE